MRKKIILRPNTFLWTVEEDGLLYNAKNGTNYKFSLCDNQILDVCKQWQNMDNLYSAYFDELSISIGFRVFADTIVEKEMGIICEENERAISIPPLLKVKEGVELKKFFEGGFHSMPVLGNLISITAFLGGEARPSNLWIQNAYPVASKDCMDVKLLSAFLSKCDQRSLRHIFIVVSDWNSSIISECEDFLLKIKKAVCFVFANSNPNFSNNILDQLVEDGFAITQVCLPDPPIENANWVDGRNYQLLVRNEEEVEYWEKLLGDNPSVKYDFKPIADNNLEFFRKNVFLSEEEILSQKLSKKDIFRHQVLNVNNFGTFYIFPDGTIHPAPDAPSIGTLEDSVHQTIIRELEENHAWRQTRRLMEPCKNCIYHDLCPSPSVYERIFGVPGCTYWKDEDKE